MEDIRALSRTHRATLDMTEVREYFRLFDRESLLMNSYTNSTEHFFAGDGGITTPVNSERDPFEVLDDLMVVVEALCPAWPQRETFKKQLNYDCDQAGLLTRTLSSEGETGGPLDPCIRDVRSGVPMADRMAVIVDDRERRSGVVQALHVSGDFDITIQRLAVGDYLVDGRFLFERKTLPDLAVRSGRDDCSSKRCGSRRWSPCGRSWCWKELPPICATAACRGRQYKAHW